MKRQPLTDNTGKWFDLAAAEKFDEDTWWNGNNHISCATGSQWDHEALYYTKGKRWILNHWSQWQGSSQTWEELDATAAAAWLVKNHQKAPAVEAEIQQLQIP